MEFYRNLDSNIYREPFDFGGRIFDRRRMEKKCISISAPRKPRSAGLFDNTIFSIRKDNKKTSKIIDSRKK